MQSPRSAFHLLLKSNLSSDKRNYHRIVSRLNSECRSSLKDSVVFCPLADRSSGRGRSRGQGHHQMRDLSTLHASPSPHDTHATFFLSQRRTVRGKRVSPAGIGNVEFKHNPAAFCWDLFSRLFIFSRPQPDSCIRVGGSEQCSQQSRLPSQAAKEERNQVLHRSTVRQERESQTGTAGKRIHGARTRYYTLIFRETQVISHKI